ncbi:hypothetical protein NX059_012167 [Plenodomus lindquistii]|nr:hypothetical protein NX059_012167 [Plenodomus lindquistii]
MPSRYLTSMRLVPRRPAESALDVHRLVYQALRKQLQVQGRFRQWTQRTITQLLREARVRETVKQRDAEQEKLQKGETKELKAAATLYKKKMAEEAKVVRQLARERAAKDRKAAAQERAAARAQKQQEKEASTTKKAHDGANKRTRATSRSQNSNAPERRRVVDAASGDRVRDQNRLADAVPVRHKPASAVRAGESTRL